MLAKCKTVLLILFCMAILGGRDAPIRPALPATIENMGSISVISDDNYPPYIFRDAFGRLQGIIVDQWALWEKKTGITANLTAMPWNEALEAMRQGQYDVIDTMFENEDRRALYDFTKPYVKIDVAIFFSRDISGIHNVESLKGFSVAAKSGDYCVGYLRDRGVTDTVEYANYEDIITAAGDKKAPVFVMDKPPAMYLMLKAGIQDKYRYTQPLYTGEFHRAVAKGNARMLSLVENGFSLLSAEEYRQIDLKWKGAEITYVDILPYIGYAALFVLLLLLTMALWNRALKRMVGLRTAELERALENLKHREQTLYELSITDPLTGFYNRNYFERKIDEFARANKTGAGYITCDLDGLKLINDTLGHASGDNYIRQAARILKRAFDETDVVARIGGDEFGILVEHASEVMLENKKAAIGEMIDRANTEPRPMPISLSMGYALWDDAGEKLPDILKKADDRRMRDKINHMQSIKSKNIEVLAHMLEARDFMTEGHGERLMELSRRLSEAAGLSVADVHDVMLLAKFHDIGKIGIPDTILFKSTVLTQEEMKVMRRHAEIGYRIAASSPDLLHIADWILKHHERYDGTGYPFGLKGTEIPVQCRIVAILDAFDAMTNDRPYRKANTLNHALEELVRNAGEQFDPYLVREFCRIAKKADACAS